MNPRDGRTHPDLDCAAPSPRYDFVARLDVHAQVMSYEWQFPVTVSRVLLLRLVGDTLTAAHRARTWEDRW